MTTRTVRIRRKGVIMERGIPVGHIVPLSPSVETRARQLVEAGLVAWNGQRLTPLAPVAPTRGQRTVADLVLEDRDGPQPKVGIRRIA